MHLPPKSLTGSSSLHPSKYTPTSSTRICMTTLQSSPRLSSHQNLSDDQVGKAQQTHTVSVHRNSYQPTSSSPNKIKYRTRQPLEITKTRPSLHPRSLPTVLQCKKPMYLLYHLSQILTTCHPQHAQPQHDWNDKMSTERADKIRRHAHASTQ